MEVFFVYLYMDKDNLRQRILIRISVSETGCWEWIGCDKKDGYGEIHVDGKNMRAHRASYTVFKEDIPNGLLVCHKCDNRKCVNPDHLFLGTHKDNWDDAVNKGRIVTPVYPKAICPSFAKYNSGCRCEICKDWYRTYYESNKQKLRNTAREYYHKNKAEVNRKRIEKRKIDPNYSQH